MRNCLKAPLLIVLASLLADFSLSAQSFTPTGSMNLARTQHSATLLNNGTVLVAGGGSDSTASGYTAEVYSPQTGTWRFTSHVMNFSRTGHTAVKLADGRVLLAGGTGSLTNPGEVFDPVTEQFTPTNPMIGPHDRSPGILLSDGRIILVVGSLLALNGPGIAEIYDPVTNSWSATPSIPVGDSEIAAVGLPDGTVLATGGFACCTVAIYPNVARYNATTNTVTPMANMIVARHNHTVTVLPGGKVLVVGGSNPSSTESSTEIYDPTAPPNGQSQLNTSLNQSRRAHSATLLPNGDVLGVGGFQVVGGIQGTTLSSAELRDHVNGTWSPAGSMSVSRQDQTATLLPSGKVLIAGGSAGRTFVAQNSAELWGTPGSATGTINVTTNLPAATFSISPAIPGAPTGGPYPVTIPNVPVGTYKVTFNQLPGYILQQPSPQTQPLVAGDNIRYSATYTLPTLNVFPLSLEFTSTQGSPLPVLPLPLLVSSSGLAVSFTTEAFTVPPGGTWLSVTPNTGTTLTPIIVSVAPLGFSKGTYFGQIILRSTGISNSPVVIPITFTVRPPSLQAKTPSLSFYYVIGATPPDAQTLSVQSDGTPVQFSARASTTSGGDWLSVTPGGATTTASLFVTASPSKAVRSVPAGTYTGMITITAAEAANSPLVVPVTFTVDTPAHLALTPRLPSNTMGQSQTFTATLLDTSLKPIANQQITFTVTGANAYYDKNKTDKSGNVTFSYAAKSQGVDKAIAMAIIGGVEIISNSATVTWAPLTIGARNLEFPPKGLQDPKDYDLNAANLWSTVTRAVDPVFLNSLNDTGLFNNDYCFTGTLSAIRNTSVTERNNIVFNALAKEIFEFGFRFIPTGSFIGDVLLKTAAHLASTAVAGSSADYGQEFATTLASKSLGYVLAKGIGQFATITGPITEDKIRDILKTSNIVAIAASGKSTPNVGFPVSAETKVEYSPDTHYVIMNVVAACQAPNTNGQTIRNYLFRYEIEKFGPSKIGINILGSPEIFLINADGSVVLGQ